MDTLIKMPVIVLSLAMLIVMLTACGGESENQSNGNPIVTLKIKGKGDIKIELYPDKAPNTVNNFISLVQDGFYDELIFHRVIPGFMIQGGDPEGAGTGGPGYSIEGEFSDNGFEGNDIKHTRGVLSMARSMHPDSAGSQFFIMHEDAPHLDGGYAAFGKVVDGMNIVDEIVKVDRDRNDRPIKTQVIKKATVKLFGKEYGEPNRIK